MGHSFLLEFQQLPPLQRIKLAYFHIHSKDFSTKLSRKAFTHTHNIMNLFSVILATLACVAAPAHGQLTGLRAQAIITLQDCLCQCSSFTFRQKGRTYGNCLSPDQTGADWCYVEPLRNLYRLIANSNRGRNYAFAQAPVSTTCPDAVTSRRYRSRQYSYNACATPRLDSSVCQRLLYQYYGANNNNNNFGNNYNNQRPGYNNQRPVYAFGSTRTANTDDESSANVGNSADDDFVLFGGISSSSDSSDDSAVVFK